MKFDEEFMINHYKEIEKRITELENSLKDTLKDPFLDRENIIYWFDNRISTLEGHKNYQIDENRKISRRVDEVIGLIVKYDLKKEEEIDKLTCSIENEKLKYSDILSKLSLNASNYKNTENTEKRQDFKTQEEFDDWRINKHKIVTHSCLSIEEAMHYFKKGKCIKRNTWPHWDVMWISENKIVSYNISKEDLLSCDWEVVI